MKCTKCGNEIPSQSKFCLSCGRPVGSEVAAPPAPARKKSTALWGVVAGLIVIAILVAGAFWLRGRGVTQAPQPNQHGTPVVKAPAPASGPQANVLQTNVKNQPIGLNSPTKTAPPADVVAYLEHLKKVEARRMELKTQEEAALISIIPHLQVDQLKQVLDWSDNPDQKNADAEKTTEDKAKDEMKTLSADWQKLAAMFLSVQAPEACQTLASKYYDALRDVISTTADMQTILVNGDIGKAYQMQGKSGHIDDKLIAADTELSNVCTKFGIDKSFSVASDTGVAPVTGLPSLPR